MKRAKLLKQFQARVKAYEDTIASLRGDPKAKGYRKPGSLKGR